MLTGELYSAAGPELAAERARARAALGRFNASGDMAELAAPFGALVGAGAVVIRELPDGATVVGNPARAPWRAHLGRPLDSDGH